MPKAQDLVKAALPFAVATTHPLNGMIFANPVSPTGSGQATRIHVDEIWWDGDQGLSKPTTAKSPRPTDKAQDVLRDTILSWTPPVPTFTHNVYFGTNSADVIAADVGAPLGVLAAAGQDANTFDPGLLDLGQTYYWRVDEVNSTGDKTPFKGSVWSFTVEPVAYPIPTVMATASSSTENMGTENTVNGSGLTGDQHSTLDKAMWLSGSSGPQPTWIRYEFDKSYKLDRLLVWNYNQIVETVVGFGARGVTVEYSADGAAWTQLGDFEFARAPSTETYVANTTVDLDGIVAKYVKLTIKSNWSGLLAQYGLSEVRFFYLPVLPREPKPASEATGVTTDSILTWRAGREAASHKVYLDVEQQAVADGTAPVQIVADNRFDPGDLSLGTTYFWKVVEVNEAETPGTWEGNVWSFTTQEYFIVDDMESYTDDEGNRIFDAWLDGWEADDNGSQVGHAQGPFAERTRVHGGKQSMPLYYDNTSPVNYSEAEMAWTSTQNWTLNGADTLSLYFRGQPTGFQELSADHILMNGIGTDIYSTADQGRFAYKQLNGNWQSVDLGIAQPAGNLPDTFYVTVKDSTGKSVTIKHPDALATTIGTWQQWQIPLGSLSGINAAKVKTLILGVGDRTAPKHGAGTLYIDDIAVGHPVSQ